MLDHLGDDAEGRVIADIAASAGRHLTSYAALAERLHAFLDSDFTIPEAPLAHGPANTMERTLALLQYQFISSAYPPSAWITRLSHELFLSVGGYGDRLTIAMADIEHDEAVGPLGCLLVSRVFSLLGRSEMAERCAMLGHRRLDEAHWNRDIELLEPFARPIIQTLGDLARPEEAAEVVLRHPDLDAVTVLRNLRTSVVDDRAHLLALAHILWEHGLHTHLTMLLARQATGEVPGL